MHYKCDMKIWASGPGLLELYPFVILLCVTLMAMAGGISEHIYAHFMV